jgi:hypothetical protein
VTVGGAVAQAGNRLPHAWRVAARHRRAPQKTTRAALGLLDEPLVNGLDGTLDARHKLDLGTGWEEGPSLCEEPRGVQTAGRRRARDAPDGFLAEGEKRP